MSGTAASVKLMAMGASGYFSYSPGTKNFHEVVFRGRGKPGGRFDGVSTSFRASLMYEIQPRHMNGVSATAIWSSALGLPGTVSGMDGTGYGQATPVRLSLKESKSATCNAEPTTSSSVKRASMSARLRPPPTCTSCLSFAKSLSIVSSTMLYISFSSALLMVFSSVFLNRSTKKFSSQEMLEPDTWMSNSPRSTVAAVVSADGIPVVSFSDSAAVSSTVDSPLGPAVTVP
mmetsp:Transcript_61160/g.85070  ORF Transcript_61160/g.85070 Transcript_61160/m.85070 type:complete len:231 (+) Transcript_61160:106-798(+)